ncbi:protein kinase [Clostridium sp. 'deep sea']|uniref:serine/threonine-protein kinase n=1 Tax=Clostridium sp. 'deep sea' TaxID=2779445 RepID=UPI0018963FCB|nr:serine/threonine-protein kinase [Clostridium sp. 'deep sea']QOR33658.1 protein kinase [Clostridium sp. 'deep sea']
MIKTGTVLLNKYLIKGMINTGGTSIIYKAYHNSLNITVALKRIDSLTLHNTNYRREVDILKHLQHKMLPRLYDIVKYGEETFIVIDYIDGLNLQQIIENKGAFTELEVLRISKDLINVLGYIHQNNIIHSDIKPANIMINKDGELKLKALGISAINNKTKALGKTKGFSAPEQSNCETINNKTDIYSFGATIYYLLTKKVYQNNKSLNELPKQFSCILKKCLQLNPTKRYNNMFEIKEQFNKLSKAKKIKLKHVNKKSIITMVSIAVFLTLLACLHINKQKNNNNYQQYIIKGENYLQANKLQQAEQSFYRAIDLNKSKTIAYLNLAEIYFKQKKYQQCIGLNKGEQKLNKDINYSRYLEFIADSYKLLTEKESAYNYYKQALKYNKRDIDLYHKFAGLACEINKNSEAKEALNKALKLVKDNAISYMLMGEVEFLNNNYKIAKDYLTKATSLLHDSKKLCKCNVLLAEIYKCNELSIDLEIQALNNAKQHATIYSSQLIIEKLANSYYRKALISQSDEYLLESAECYHQLLFCNINDIHIYKNLIALYLQLNDLNKANKTLGQMKKYYNSYQVTKSECFIKIAELKQSKNKLTDLQTINKLLEKLKNYSTDSEIALLEIKVTELNLNLKAD